MEIKVMQASVQRMVKQRNLFLLLTLILGMSVFLISLRLATFDQKIVMIPGITAEMSVSDHHVSTSYLEQMTLIFLSQLLDISISDIKHKKDLVLKYTSHSSPSYSKKINDYFSQVEDEYNRFDLATHFTIKNMIVDAKNLVVIASGVLTFWYGKKGHESKEVNYKISFDYSGGFLRLKEFNLIKEEK